MKIYKASYRDEHSEHKGYEYFSSKKEAEKAQKTNNVERGKDVAFSNDEVEEIEFKLSKKGILNLLNIHCGHPDNG